MQSHNHTIDYTPGNSDLVVCLKVKTFDSWCRDGNFFLQITGCDGTMVQFMPALGLDEEANVAEGAEGNDTLVELEYMRWKAALSVATSKSVLDERRWFLRSSTLPKPWERLVGKMYRAKMNGVTPVAVKHINVSEHAESVRVDQEKYIQFLNETLIACTAQGPSLLQFYGIFWGAAGASGAPHDYYVVTELCVGGNLRSALYDDASSPTATSPTTATAPTFPPFSSSASSASFKSAAATTAAAALAARVAKPRLSNAKIQQILMEILAGVAYMHDNNVVHRDLRPEHILLQVPLDAIDRIQPGIVKIADHAKSKVMSDTTLGSGVLLMQEMDPTFFVYQAPETLGPAVPGTRTCLFTPKCDVYAVGIIACEMWERRFPWSSTSMNVTPGTLKGMIETGARQVISSDCPAGLQTLIMSCWQQDQHKRISSADALKLSRKPVLLAPFECESWSDIVEAIESKFWCLTQQLRARISAAIKAMGDTKLSPSEKQQLGEHNIEIVLAMAALDASADDTPVENLITYLEALHFFTANAPAEAYKAVFAKAENAELIAGMLQVMQEGAAINLHVVEICHRIVRFAPDCEFWQRFVQDCVALAELHVEDKAPVLHACLSFFASNMVQPALRHTILSSGAAYIAMDVAASCPDDIPLQTTCASLLLEASAEAQHRAGILANLSSILNVMETHDEEIVLLTRWMSVLKHATSNPLGAFEIIRAAGLPVVIKGVRRHSNNVPFLLEAMIVLQNIGAEPMHVEDLADSNVPLVTVMILGKMQNEPEVATACCSILASIFTSPPLRGLIKSTPLLQLVIETMRMHPQNGKVLAAAMLLVARLTQNEPHYIRQALDDNSQGVFVKSLWNFRAAIDVVRPGLTVFGILAIEFSERTRMVEQDVPRLVVDSMRHFNEDVSVQVEALTTLCVLANDKSCRTAIKDAGGIATTLVAVTKHRGHDQMMQLALEVLLQLVMDPSTRRFVREAKIVSVLADILRLESGRARLIMLSVSMLAVLAHHENIAEEFVAEKLKPTIEGLMLAFKGNAALQHDGQAAIQKTMPVVETKRIANPFKVVIVGKLNVGKTSLLQRACTNTFSPHSQSTIGVHIDYAKIEFPSQNVTLQVYDTAGEERFRALTKSFYRGAHGAILVYDTTREDSLDELSSFAQDIKAAVPHDVQLLVLGTKTDLKESQEVEQKDARKFAKSVGARHFPVSALQNIGVHKAFKDLTERLLRRWPAGPPSDPNIVVMKTLKLQQDNGCC